MPAQITRLSLDPGVRHFHCPVCGSALIDDESGITEELCDHVVAVVDWSGELIVGRAAAPELGEALQTTFGSENEDVVKALATILPDTVVAFDFIEKARGGGYEGSSITFAVDFALIGQEATEE